MMIVVCGCSFSTPSIKTPGMHWSEILSKKTGAKVLNLSRKGASNGYIRLQLESAIKCRPDWIIINTSSPNRIELPINKSNIVRKKRYGLNDFHNNTFDYHMTYELMTSLLDGIWKLGELSHDKKHAIEQYFLHLYDESWKIHLDHWILSGGLWEAHYNGIKITYDPYFLSQKIQDTMPLWFQERYYVPKEYSYYNLCKNYNLLPEKDPGYHLNDDAQHLLAEYHANRIYNFDNKIEDS